METWGGIRRMDTIPGIPKGGTGSIDGVGVGG